MTSQGTAPATFPTRVQRLVDVLPPVHLEAAVPEAVPTWTLRVEGMVRRPLELGLDELRRLGAEEIVADHHCVWGWSRRACRWTGVRAGAVLDLAGPLPGATTVTVACRAAPYAACLELADAREGILAWGLDGRDLPPENGWPLRFQNPPWLWGYKGVKWAGALFVGDRFVPGFWEAKTADPRGRVPDEVLLPFETEEDE
jgi:DMSO/TMAO reductase YedYZ molybdopterin-dependent catalytic subunit